MINSDAFNNAVNDAVETGKRVVQKTGEIAADVAETARLRFRISQVQSELRQKYRVLGKLCCACMSAGGTEFDDRMKALYSEICTLHETLESLREAL